MAARNLPRTVIEFKDYAGAEDAPCHKVSRVFIDGTEVLVEKDGIDIEYGDHQATVVTLRLLPTEIHFNH